MNMNGIDKESIAYQIIAWLRDNRPEWLAYVGVGLTIALMVRGDLQPFEGLQITVALLVVVAGYLGLRNR